MATAQIDGCELYYEERGDGPPLLLSHGSGPDASVWGDVPDRLAARGFRVISYDRRGFSRSVHPPVRTVRRHGLDAGALLTQLDARPAVVIGWSAGGRTAVDLAVREPEAVKALVLVEAPTMKRSQIGGDAVRGLAPVMLLARLGRKRQAATRFYEWALAYSDGGSAWHTTFTKEWRRACLENADAVLDGDMNAHDGQPASAIRSLPMPITWVEGERTREFFHHARRMLLEAAPSTSVVTISGASHAPHADDPEAFIEAVADAARRAGAEASRTVSSV